MDFAQWRKGALILQIIKFGIVGVIAAAVDVGTLVVLKEWLHMDVLIASAISFSVSVIVNYLLSMTFVFKSKKHYRNARACKKGAMIGLGILAAIILIFVISLILVVV